MTNRKEKVAELIKEKVAEFLSRENNRTSLITVTSANASPDLKKATVFITVLPENKEKTALLFANGATDVDATDSQNLYTAAGENTVSRVTRLVNGTTMMYFLA